MAITPAELQADPTGTIISKLNSGGGTVTYGSPVEVGTANADGSGPAVARANHVHGHGNQTIETLHALAVAGVSHGFFDKADKTKLDGISAGAGGGLAPIDTLVNLGLLVATSYPDGTKIYVNEVEDTYVLEKTGAHTADGLCVIAAVGGGYWVARNVGRWEDVQGSIGQGAGAALLTVEAYRDTAFLMWYMRHDQNDALNFVFQFPHRWKYNTAVVPHLHILPAADPAVAQVARFDGYYAWSRPGYAAAPLPALVGWTAFGPIDVTINPGDVYIQKIVSLGSVIPPAYVRGSTCLLIWLRRAGTDPGDTYTTPRSYGPTNAANIGLLSTDVHYRLANQGSETEIPV